MMSLKNGWMSIAHHRIQRANLDWIGNLIVRIHLILCVPSAHTHSILTQYLYNDLIEPLKLNSQKLKLTRWSGEGEENEMIDIIEWHRGSITPFQQNYDLFRQNNNLWRIYIIFLNDVIHECLSFILNFVSDRITKFKKIKAKHKDRFCFIPFLQTIL